MLRAEYNATILNDYHIVIPQEVRDKLFIKPDMKIKVIIEAKHDTDQEEQYSFQKVRNLLSGIKGDLSSDIIADREDRI